MPESMQERAWTRALELARSGKYKRGSGVEDALRSEGFSKEVNAWRDRWEPDRLDQLCRDAHRIMKGDEDA